MKQLAVAVFGFMMAGVAVGANWTNDLKNRYWSEKYAEVEIKKTA